MPSISIKYTKVGPMTLNRVVSMKIIAGLVVLGNVVGLIYIFRHQAIELLISNLRAILSLIAIVSIGILGGNIGVHLGQDSMLGMLFGGILLRNLFPTTITQIPHSWTSILWTIALCAVLSRAALSLQKDKVVPHIFEALLLGTAPVLMEASVMTLLARLVFDIPTSWAATLAFGVATISPGVVVPLILKLVENGWQGSRLPPLLLTALGIDVLVGTAGFGISLASCFKHQHELSSAFFHDSWIGRGIEEVGVGVGLGCLIGLGAIWCTRSKVPESVATLCVFILSAITMTWCKKNGFTGAASCATFVTWYFVANTWTKKEIEYADIK